jgi:Family of unknown function (DUF5685)
MFGLMKAKTCGMSADEKHFRRMHYCGTCKTIGSIYGQKARLLLNHDTVFLAELLTSLTTDNAPEWGRSIQSYNCLSLPRENIPISLKYASAANVILAEFKLSDRITDENSVAVRIAKRQFSDSFLTARRGLADFDLPVEKITQILAVQEEREAQSLRSRENAESIIDALSGPTASVTSLFFSGGARLIGKGDFSEAMQEIGRKFGKLVYLLDALEDYESDFRKNQFNTLRAAFRLYDLKLPSAARRKTAAILRGLESDLINEIYELPIEESKKELFARRLDENLRRKLRAELPVIKSRKFCVSAPKSSFAQRWKAAVDRAYYLARQSSWQMPLIFLVVLVFALAAPAQTREAKSARECFNLGFNLMFLGSIVGAVMASAGRIVKMEVKDLPPVPASTATQNSPGRKPPRQKGGGGCGDCGDWCCACDACCDAGDCCCDCGSCCDS